MHAGEITAGQVRTWLENVTDPEIPVLTIGDLGILRDVRDGAHGLEVVITPTYSGCPAMRAIEADVRAELARHGLDEVRVVTQLAPAWTTDWLTNAGRRKLHEYGITPPQERSDSKRSLWGGDPVVPCPQCGSRETTKISEFGSTACKALYRCESCLEPFDYFKCL